MQLPYVEDLVLLMLPALALIFTWLHHARAIRGRIPSLRPLPGIAALDARLSDVAESGRPIHVATGAGQPGSIGPTAETLASLLVAQRLSEAASRRGGHVIATTGDIFADTAVRGPLRKAYQQTAAPGDVARPAVQLVAHQTPVAYAAGVTGRYAVEPMDTSVVVGNFGPEALLIGEEGAQRRLPQLSGTTSLTALPGLILSTDATLIGEELFAAEAYLTDAAAPKARLMTQDTLRQALALLIVLGVIYQVLTGYWTGLPSL